MSSFGLNSIRFAQRTASDTTIAEAPRSRCVSMRIGTVRETIENQKTLDEENETMKLTKTIPWVAGCAAMAVLMILISDAMSAESAAGERSTTARKREGGERKREGDGARKREGGGERKREGEGVRKESGSLAKFYSDDEINAELGLTSEQQKKFDAARQKRQDALAKWDAGPKGQKLQELEITFAPELQTAVKEAAPPQEQRKAKAAIIEIRRLQSARNLIEKRFEPVVMSSLPPQAKAIRTGYKLYNKLMAGRLGEVISSRQAEKIKSYCMQAGEGIVKGSLSTGAAERRLQKLAITSLNDGQKKKLGIRVQEKKTEGRKTERRKTERKKTERGKTGEKKTRERKTEG